MLLGVVWLLLAVGDSVAAVDRASERKRHVLVLNSFHQGDPWTDRQVDGIEQVFSAVPDAELHIEYMDAQRMHAARSVALLESLYRIKYRDLSVDLIIAVDDEALEAVVARRDELFPGVPLVFSGINEFSPERLAALENTSGIIETTGYAANLTLMLKLHPELRRLYVIDSEVGHGDLLRAGFEQAAGVLEGRVALEYLSVLGSDRPIADLGVRLARLPPNSAVFYLAFSGGAGRGPLRAVPLLATASNAPIYASDDYLLGYGIVGGYLKDAKRLGVEVAEIALKILAGTRADRIPRARMPHSYRFDYRQLQRFDIALGELPRGSDVINRPDTFFSRYQHLIWSTLALMLALMVYIAVLLNSIRKRKKVQRGLKSILDHSQGLLPYESAADLASGLQTRLAGVVAVNGRMQGFYCQAPKAVGGVGAITQITPDYRGDAANPALVEQAARQHRSATDGNEFALYFAASGMPVNLLYGRVRAPLDTIDGYLLDVFANTTSSAIDNIEKFKLLEAIDSARRIQEAMLPRGFDALAGRYGIDLNARLLPAKEVSGDLYDVIELDRDQLCLVIGDVSDKGVPSALFMARTVTLIRATAQVCGEPEQIVDRVNRELCRDNDMSMFVTLFLAVYDRRDGGLSYVNGGHNRPFVLRAGGRPEALQLAEGIALGVMEEAGYQRQRIELASGDALFAYTDGVTEAMDSQHRQFGEPRLVAVLKQLAAADAADLNRGVLQRTSAFVRGAPHSDDITLLCLRRSKRENGD